MDAWRERGNKRTSLVMSMYGDAGAVSEFGLDGNPDDSWHFNVSVTMAVSVYYAACSRTSACRRQTFRPCENGGSSTEFPTPPTAATPVTAPRSLRHLFEDANAPTPTPDPFRAGPSNGGISPSSSALLSLPRYDDNEPESRTSTIRPNAFNGAGPSEGYNASTRRQHRRDRSSASTSSSSGLPKTPGESFGLTSSLSSSGLSTATYRDVRSTKGLPTITIPSASAFNGSGPSSDSHGGAAAQSPVASTSRARHQLTASIDSTSSSNSSSSPQVRNRKLHMPLEPPEFPSAMFRSGSESPLRGLPGTRRPSIARQASVAVMETSPAPALPSPVPRPAVSRNNTALVTTGATVVSGSRNRSMSRGEHSEGFDRSGFTSPYPPPPPTPTSGMPPTGRYGATTPHLQPTGGSLKDVLKMAPMPAAGQNDLLPPSPSVHSSTANRFNFLPLPSPLSHSHSQSNLHASHSQSNLHAAAQASPGGASPSSYGHGGHAYFAGTRPASPPMGTLQQQQQHRRQPSQEAATAMGLSYDGQPPLRPLDYNRLATASDVHHELERTAIDLGRWLDLIDVGLGGLLLDLPLEAGNGVH